MEAVTLEGLVLIIQKQNEEIKQLTGEVRSLKNQLDDVKREIVKSSSPWVRGWQGVADYTQQSRASIVGNTDLKRSLTQYKVTGKTVLFKKSDIDESIEGTAIR